MKTLRILLSFGMVFSMAFATACGDDDGSSNYEICNNLVDDDGDGLTDCADSDCINAANCMVTCDNDGICDTGENSTNCPNDCPVTTCDNDGTCDVGENSTNCPNDCPATTCDNDGTCDAGENSTNCPNDCPAAGDCSTVSDLVDQVGCQANEKCTIVDAGGTLGCVAAGTNTAYSDCDSDDCEAGTICAGQQGSQYTCMPFCEESADCPGGGVCGAAISTAAGQAGLCLAPDNCNLADPATTCDTNEGCYLANVTTGDTICAPAGTAAVTEACSAANDCAAGLGCAGNVCVQWCTASTTCTTGTCQEIGSLPGAHNSTVGICQ